MKNKRLGLKILLGILTLSLFAINMPFSIQAAPISDTASFGEVLINEFVVTGTSDETIELYNTLGVTVNVTDWQIWHTTAGVFEIMGNITSEVVIPANGYVEINDSSGTGNMDDFTLSNAGDSLQLRDVESTIIDSVAYGTEGGAPVHPYGGSIARVATGGTDASDWNIDMTPTLMATNDAPGVDLGGTDIVINEINVDQHFVELYNTHSYNIINLDGWFMSGGTLNVLDLSGVSINPKGFALFQDLSPGTYDFLQLNSYGDPDHVIHLYNSTGHRVAQLGWNTNVDPKSWARYPDGNTTGFYEDGWDNITSGFIPLGPTPGSPNSDNEYATIPDVVITQSTVALDGSVDVAVKATWSNGTAMDSASVSVDFNGTPIALTFDAGSDYFNGTVDFTGFVPQTGVWGEYHTTELTFMVDGTISNASKTAGIFVNPGYATADTVIMFDESHDTFYDFHTAEKAGYVLSWILETEMADYFVILDAYDFYFRLDSAVVTDVDLLIIPDPDSDLTDAWLTSSEVDTIVDYVESGGSLWLSSSRGYFSNPDVNGLAAITSNWGIVWYDGSYQDDVNNKGSNYNAKVTPEFADGSSFDDFDAFGVEEYYYNGMVINHTTDVVGVNVTKAVPARYGSTWENDSIAGYNADMNSLVDEFAIAYVVETGTGKAFVTGSCSTYTYPSDYEDDMQSGQFVFNVFAYLLGIDPIQYPTLTLTDMVGAQTVLTTDTSVSFKVKLSSSLSGATFSNVEVSGLLSGSLVTFADAGNGEYTATWDATTVSAGTYTLVVSASAENAAGALFIPTTVSLTVTVEEPAGTTTTEPDTTTTGAAPGFGIATLLTTLSLIGVAYTFIRKRR